MLRRSVSSLIRLIIAAAVGILAMFLVLTAACAPGFTGTPSAGLPAIQKITVQVLLPEAATITPEPTGTAPTVTPSPGENRPPPDTPASESLPAPGAAPSPGASPAPGVPPTSVVPTTPADTASGLDIVISIETVNFDIVNKPGEEAAPGEGMVYFYLDAMPPVQPGTPAFSTPGTYVAVQSNSYTWPDVKPGLHILSAELVNNDHTPLEVPAVAAVMMRAPDAGTASLPQIMTISAGFSPSAMSPGPGATIPALPTVSPPTGSPPGMDAAGVDITVSILPANFSIVPEQGQPSSSGEGHIHYFLDTVPAVFPGLPPLPEGREYVHSEETSFTWAGIQPGVHLVTAELVNNDHTSLSPPVAASCLLTVIP